jgi:23S rRNA (uracil1939-C5)-methyltransferase
VTLSGDRVEVSVHAIASGGAGVAHLPDGRAVFVHRTAPGDRARIEVTGVKKRWARGRVLELLEPGPGRREPPCPHYERCGGCTLEHLRYEAQLEVKGRMVTDALARIGGLEVLPPPELHPAPREIRYRNRVSFTLRRLKGDRVVAGFHELERPDRILDLDGRCLLPEEPVAKAWDALRAAWGPGARRFPPGAEIRVTLRGTEEGSVILLVEGAEGPWDEADARALLEGVPALRSAWVRSPGRSGGGADGTPGVHHDGEPGPHPTAEPTLIAGDGDVEEHWYGERIPVRPGAFLQVNREAASHLHDLVLREAGVPRGRTILDAYCGFGVYGRRLARHGGVAVGIESDPGAAAMARSRPQEGFTLMEGRVEDRLGEALPADLAILNPPRAGVADGVMERMGGGGGERGPGAPPARIVYVSCDPATLARDVKRLGPGYAITRLQVVDLFPQTAHVETVLTLDRGAAPEPVTTQVESP